MNNPSVTQAYKVVYASSPQCYAKSAVALVRRHGLLNVNYVQGRVITPKIGMLFTFLTTEAAKRFILNHLSLGPSDYNVWEVEAYNGREIPYVLGYTREESKVITERTRKFWEIQEKYKGQPASVIREALRHGNGLGFIQDTPVNTWVCEGLKLIKKVEGLFNPPSVFYNIISPQQVRT